MKILDKTESGLLGIVKVERIHRDGTVTIVDEENLVLNRAAEILRNLMFGDNAERISKIHFGDLGLTENDDVKNVPTPSPGETTLVRKLFEKAVSRVRGEYQGHPAIIYTVTLLETEFNGPSGQQLITEYALANDYDKLFTKKNRAAIYKDSESSLKFTWTLVFN